MAGSADQLVSRIRKYFRRQQDFVVAMEKRLPESLEGLDDFQELLAIQAQSVQQLAEFQREQNLLLREWEHAAVEEEDRRAVHEEGGRIAAKLQSLREKIIQLEQEAARRRLADEEVLRQMRRGRSMLDAYRPGGDGPPGGTGWKA
jgi:seryl-tRNA synthetase